MCTWRVSPIFMQQCWYAAATSFTLTLLCICCCRSLQLSVLRLLCCSTHSVVYCFLLPLWQSVHTWSVDIRVALVICCCTVCFVVWMPEKAYLLEHGYLTRFLQLWWMMIVSEPNDRRIHYLLDILMMPPCRKLRGDSSKVLFCDI